MFTTIDEAALRLDYPQGSTFRERDWRILASFWHPVAYAHAVRDDHPVAARLLDIDLVVYRSANGVTVARDQCPHRGTRLSAGCMVSGQLVCPMHGLHFDAAGTCQRIPAIPGVASRIPEKLSLKPFQVVERYGLVWVLMNDNAINPLPDWPITEDASRNAFVPATVWRCSAPRHVENFNDVAHFPWVHSQSFGGDADAAIPPYAVESIGHALRFELPYTENFNRFPDGVEGSTRDVVYKYELTFPFSTLITIEPKGSSYQLYVVDTVCPASAHSSVVFSVISDNSAAPDVAYWQRDSEIIAAEDIPLVEGQTPKNLPLDLRLECSLPFDRMSMEYRLALVRRFGLGAV